MIATTSMDVTGRIIDIIIGIIMIITGGGMTVITDLMGHIVIGIGAIEIDTTK